MAQIIKNLQGQYELGLAPDSIIRAFGNGVGGEYPKQVDAQDKHYTETILVTITEDFANYARALCSQKLHLEDGFGSQGNEVSIIQGLMKAPLPMAPVYTDVNGSVPQLSASDISNMSTNLENVQRDFTFTVSIQVPNGGSFSLIFMPDARGFNIIAVDPSKPISLDYSHPFILTKPIKTPFEQADRLTDGEATISGNFSVDDARIYKFSTEESVKFGETISGSLSTIRGDNEYTGSFIRLYEAVHNEMFWREGANQTKGEITGDRPWTSVLYGVSPEGRSIQIVDIRDCERQETAAPGINMMLTGSVTSTYVYGDIKYPADPRIGSHKPVFDIISDSEGWTKYGPTSVKYVDGEDGDKEAPMIFSWEGRRSSSPKILPRVAAQLEKFE